MKEGRNRMIVEIPPEVQMAIKLRAIKNGWTTGEVVAEAFRWTFLEDLEQARKIMKEKKTCTR